MPDTGTADDAQPLQPIDSSALPPAVEKAATASTWSGDLGACGQTTNVIGLSSVVVIWLIEL